MNLAKFFFTYIYLIDINTPTQISCELPSGEKDKVKMLKVLYAFTAEGGQELSVKEGELLQIVPQDAGDGGWMARYFLINI